MNITRRSTTDLAYFYAGYFTRTETRTEVVDGVMAVVLN